MRDAVAMMAILLAGAAPPSDAGTCGMTLAFANPDDESTTTTTAVWHDADGHALLFGDALHVNTDGTRRSYKVTDFWGTNVALNTL